MNKLWDIKVFYSDNGNFKIKIASFNEKVEGEGTTPHRAWTNAMNKLVIRPWLESKEYFFDSFINEK